MTKRIKLRHICHARSGDKRDIANVGLIVYNPAHYVWIERHVTAEAVAEYVKSLVKGPVERYTLPNIGALNFVLHNALDGGVTRTLRLDGHGKTYSSILLEFEIDAPPDFELTEGE